ncbi:MAG: tRNA (guanosine(46)-N7)-methyltransferase TrmB [Candidatus Cloacimonetes bacterium]|nr:tRNA (guanosine(46)-N7)-methyltransferase TrmB [Candidatus Cloacimonadota bacterium]
MNLEEKRAFFEIDVTERKLLDFKEIFGNDNQVFLEIGSGMGEFLRMRSLINHNRNFIGIEIKEKRLRQIVNNMDVERHKNVRVMRLFVDEAVTEIIPEGSIKHVFINHPDPWPKQKHHKNRIIQDKFIDTLNKLLKRKGIVWIATDDEEYAKWIVEKFSKREDFVSMYEGGFSRLPEAGHIVTYFEEMKRKEGFDPYFLKFRKQCSLENLVTQD